MRIASLAWRDRLPPRGFARPSLRGGFDHAIPNAHDWLDSIFFGVVFVVAVSFLRGRDAEDFDHYLSTTLIRRSTARRERATRKRIKELCAEETDTKKEEALMALWRSIHKHYPRR